MTVKSIEINNILSFERLIINDLSDINCIVGRNNSGKSNLLKLIHYFYKKLEGERELAPELNSNYSSFGEITIEYDTSRIFKIVTSKSRTHSPFFRHIYNEFFYPTENAFSRALVGSTNREATLRLTLRINSDESTVWSESSDKLRQIVNYLYPFFEIQTRHIDLYDWNQLWTLVARLKSFRVQNLSSEEIKEFFNTGLSGEGNSYREYVETIQSITQTSKYSYREKVLNYVKVGLEGQTFLVDGGQLETQSDGTNSYNYVDIFLKLLISLTRRDYIAPSVFIDEPEVGLHPKMSENLIQSLKLVYDSYKKIGTSKQPGKYATPYPKIIFATHSPNIVKSTIKLFPGEHKVFHFTKGKSEKTSSRLMVSKYADNRFLNTFGDNEARLFFSDFIIFVEGETEIELFGNPKLASKFKELQKADVYKTNAVSLGGINPSFSNAAIPYLVLYDLDKFITVDIGKKILHIKNDIIDIGHYREKYRRSYINSDHREAAKSLRRIESLATGSNVVMDAKRIYIEEIDGFDGENIHSLVDFLNEDVLARLDIYVVPTTIEGALICNESIPLIVNWLKTEIRVNLNVRHIEGGGSSKKLSSISKKFNLNDLGAGTKAAKICLERCVATDSWSAAERSQIIQIKKAYIRDILHHFSSHYANNGESICALRLVFKGKTESLVACDNKNYSKLDKNFKNSVTELKKVLSPIDYLLGKTSGWVTKFVDYSVIELDKNRGSHDFDTEFKDHFPYLYGILEKLHP